MPAVKKSISIPETLYKLAEEAAAAEHYPTFSDYLQSVLRQALAGRRATTTPPAKQKRRTQKGKA